MATNPATELRSFGALVEAHYAAVLAVAFAVTRDVTLSEDVAQEAFIAAWDGRARVRDVDRVRPWLCGIARNQARKALRRRGREHAVTHELADGSGSALDTMIDREARTALRDALGELSPQDREPLVLFYWEDSSIARVASALAISEQAAQKRISRARHVLKAELASALGQLALTRASRGAATAAAVCTILAARGSRAQASTLGPRLRSSVAAGAGAFAATAAALAVGLAVAREPATGSSAVHPAVHPAAVARATTVPTTTRSHSSPSLSPLVAPTSAPSSAAASFTARTGRLGGQLPVPASYELTVHAEGNAAVNLNGGRSSIEQSSGPASVAVRRIRGRVVGPDGRPVAGAVVLAGGSLWNIGPNLLGDGGATSRQDGSFEVKYDADEGYAIAVHPRGWSAPIAIPEGRADVEIQLPIAAPGPIEIRVRRGDAPTEARMIIKQPGLVLDYNTDEHGAADIALLAPGTYGVSAFPRQLGDGTRKPTKRTITTSSGTATQLTIEIEEGALVVATVRVNEPLDTIEWFLQPGRLAEPTLEKVSRPTPLPGLGNGGYVVRGEDVGGPMQFHDVGPGEYTVCAYARAKTGEQRPLRCRPVDVDGDATVEVQIAL